MYGELASLRREPWRVVEGIDGNGSAGDVPLLPLVTPRTE